MLLLSWGKSEPSPLGRKGHTTFCNCKPDEARNESPNMKFQKIICHFWADEGWRPPFSMKWHRMFGKCSPHEAMNQSPSVQFQNIDCHFCADYRAMQRRFAWSYILFFENVRKNRLGTRALPSNFKTMYASSDLRRDRGTRSAWSDSLRFEIEWQMWLIPRAL